MTALALAGWCGGLGKGIGRFRGEMCERANRERYRAVEERGERAVSRSGNMLALDRRASVSLA